ncbi:MAG: MATE family efflux transporter [Thermovirgaceae bacterium]|nr:MATE family efflux transporter [Thermovirgaceae bacterium]
MGNDREQMLANESVGKLIWKLSLPAMVGMFVNGLYNLVDTIYIGHSVGSLGIAGLSVAFPIQMIIGGTGAMLGIGTASLISRSLGAKDYETAQWAFGNNVLATAVLGIIYIIFGRIFLPQILSIFGASAEILPYASAYMGVIFLGSPLIIFTMSMNSVIRSEGAAKTAMWSMLVGAIANIILDPIFIFGLGMGIRGAAIATVLSRILTIAWIAWFFLSGKSAISFRPADMAPRFRILREIFTVGFPALLHHASSSLVFGLINQMLGFYGGNIAVAVFGVNNRIIIFSAMPTIGIAQGMQPIAGYNYGAGNYRRTLEAIVTSNRLALAFCSGIALLLLVFPEPVLRIFTTDPALLEVGPHAMRLMVAGFFLAGYNKVAGSAFQALGKAFPAFLINTARPVLFFVPLLMIMPRYLGINGVWFSFAVADILSFILTVFFLMPLTRSLRAPEPLPEGA